MAVTVQVIGEKEFKIKAHGYDQDEVDEFLDEIADELEVMENEIRDLNARLAAQPAAQPQPQRAEPSPASELQEESVRNLLINAQRVCDETIANAQSRAEELVADAREQSEKIVTDARNETKRLQEQMETLRSAAAEYRARFQQLLDDQAQVLKGETELFKKAK